jgi:CelD/BcsL family acetyltransferase involved in cellulose biosynthesis
VRDEWHAEELELTGAAWLEFVASRPEALPYHHPAWAATVAEPYGFRGFALVVRDRAGQIAAGLPVVEVKAPLRPRRWVSLPFTDVLPPLARNDAAVEELVAELAAHRERQGVGVAEIRAEVQGPGVHAAGESYAHVLALQQDPDAVFRTFKRSQVQGAIEKGLREGAAVRVGTSPEDLTDVFYALHAQTRRRHGVPVQPRRFFESLWRRIVEPGLGFVLMAEVDARPVAGAVFLTWNGGVIYKYSAALPEFSAYRPTNVVLWHAIRWACENGYHTFDFGRTDLDNEGLRAFKRGWGTEERLATYSAIGDRPPAPAARSPRIVAALVRHSPVALSRLLGELFYRYAA